MADKKRSDKGWIEKAEEAVGIEPKKAKKKKK